VEGRMVCDRAKKRGRSRQLINTHLKRVANRSTVGLFRLHARRLIRLQLTAISSAESDVSLHL
jgi:hypothetical protein